MRFAVYRRRGENVWIDQALLLDEPPIYTAEDEDDWRELGFVNFWDPPLVLTLPVSWDLETEDSPRSSAQVWQTAEPG